MNATVTQEQDAIMRDKIEQSLERGGTSPPTFRFRLSLALITDSDPLTRDHVC